MSGFQMPAKAKTAGARPLDLWSDDALREEVDAVEMAGKVLDAALPVLAVDPDLRKRVFLAVERGECSSATGRSCHAGCRCEATTGAVLAALFGVASPSTKETENYDR